MVKREEAMVQRSTVTAAVAVASLAVHEDSGARRDRKFKGVRKRKWGKWVSEIRLPKSRQRIWLGSYDSAGRAARAFDAAVFCLRGPDAKFNFPDSPPEIPGGRFLTPPEIKVAAKEFANSAPVPALPELFGPESPAPSPSVSEASSVLTTESDLCLDVSFLDLLLGPDSDSDPGPGPSEPGFGTFPGIEEFPSDFYGMQFPSVGSGELDLDQFLVDSFLWGF